MRTPVGHNPEVDHPLHYGGADDPYETIKVLRAWLTPEEYRGFLKGTAIKYASRMGKKGKDTAPIDAGKHRFYAAALEVFEKEMAEAEAKSFERMMKEMV